MAGSFGGVLLAAALVANWLVRFSLRIACVSSALSPATSWSGAVHSVSAVISAVHWPAAGRRDYRAPWQRGMSLGLRGCAGDIVVLAQISCRYAAQHRIAKGKPKAIIANPLPRTKSCWRSAYYCYHFRNIYMASISSYYTFYLMQYPDYQYKTRSSICLLSCLRWLPTVIGAAGGAIKSAGNMWMGFISRRRRLPCFTLRHTVLDGDFNGDYRLYSRVGVFRHSWCMPVSCCRDASVWFPACFSGLPSGWGGSAQRCWG